MCYQSEQNDLPKVSVYWKICECLLIRKIRNK